MTKFRRSRPLALALTLLFPSTALAMEAAVAPFLPKPGVDQKVAFSVTSLVSSEMDFMSQYEAALMLDAAPAGYNLTCLGQAACLKKVGATTGKDHLLAGSVALAGDKYEIEMILFDVAAGTVIRKQVFKLGASPESLADGIGKCVRTIVTGEGATKVEEAMVTEDFTDEDEFEFEAPTSSKPKVATPGNSNNALVDAEDPEEERRAAEEAAAKEAAAKKAAADAAAKKAAADAAAKKAAAEAAAAQKAADEAAARKAAEDAARKKAEADARARAEAEARRRAEEEAARLAAAEEEEEVSTDDINFGAVDLSSIEVDTSEINFGSASEEVAEVEEVRPSTTSKPSSSSSSSSSKSTKPVVVYEDEDEDEEEEDEELLDEDEDLLDDPDERDLSDLDEEPRSSSSKSSTSKSNSSSSSSKPSSSSSKSSSSSSSKSGSSSSKGQLDEEDDRQKMSLTFRGGASRLDPLSFVTYGGELSIPVASGLSIKLGVEAFSTQRTIPEALQDQFGGRDKVWNTIAPVNVGLSYQGGKGAFKPYVGGDLTVTPYRNNPIQVAPGARVRVGSDIMVSDSFGFNVNLSGGVWYGKEFDQVHADMDAVGLVPQISGGTVILF